MHELDQGGMLEARTAAASGSKIVSILILLALVTDGTLSLQSTTGSVLGWQGTRVRALALRIHAPSPSVDDRRSNGSERITWPVSCAREFESPASQSISKFLDSAPPSSYVPENALPPHSPPLS